MKEGIAVIESTSAAFLGHRRFRLLTSGGGVKNWSPGIETPGFGVLPPHTNLVSMMREPLWSLPFLAVGEWRVKEKKYK